MAKKADAWTADRMRACLRNRFTQNGMGNGYRSVVMEEVASGTGSLADSWIDVAVFELWPSSGLTRKAIEIKASRGDFLKELATPDKNAWARRCFHEFWFCAPPAVAKEQEMPEGIGLLVPRGDTVVVKRAAARKENADLSDELLASFMRSAYKSISTARQQAIKDALRDSREHQAAKRCERVVERFLAAHGKHYYGDSEEELAQALAKCTVDEQAKEKLDKTHSSLARFRDHMRQLFPWFAAMAYVGLGECDDLSKRIYGYWGVKDQEAWDEIARRAKDSGSASHCKSALGFMRNFRRISGLPLGQQEETDERAEEPERQGGRDDHP